MLNIKANVKKRMSIMISVALMLNILGLFALTKEVSADSYPKITSVEMVDKNPSAGLYPTLKIKSQGASSVQYSVYLYSKTKKIWENVSNGYTTAIDGNNTYMMKLRKPLHEGENSFSVWVKKSYANPINKGGYDDFQNFRINVNANPSSSQVLPSIKSATIASTEQYVGTNPSLNISSIYDGEVQYSVYLYSPANKVWENVTEGYTAPVNAGSTTRIKLNKSLHKGENSFSIWVKRAGKDPANNGGYDNFLSYRINAKELESSSVPTIEYANIPISQQKIGVKPTISIKATGNEKVQYSVYLYSPSKKTWEDVGYGYTEPQSPSIPYNFQSKIALHEGENSFSVWVKRVGQAPLNKGGYDSFLNYKVNTKSQSSTIPKITNVNIDSSQVKLGGMPDVKIASSCDVNVQYSMYLYSQSKGIWENASGGYTDGVSPHNQKIIKLTKPLQPGKNTLSIWVKRAGFSPIDQGGYDSYVHEIVNVPVNMDKAPKISSVTYNEELAIQGVKPEITVNSNSGDGSNISYKTFLYSNNKREWIESSKFTEPVPSGESKTFKLDVPLEEYNNKIIVWAKRSFVSGEVCEDYKTIEINAKRPSPLKKLIIIDPGHGGKDSGAVSPNGTKERDIALSVSLNVGNTLKAKGYDVIYTRENNDNVNWDSSNQSASLRYRTNFANSKGADLYISIHCNSSDPPGSGTETFYSKNNPNKDKALATSIQGELIKAIGLRDRGAKAGSLYVLNNTNMSASLVELAFINNISEEQKLKDPVFQQKAATGIVNGIIKYISN